MVLKTYSTTKSSKFAHRLDGKTNMGIWDWEGQHNLHEKQYS